MPRTSAQGRSTATASATTSVEDYAKTIYGLAEWEGAAVTASALAKNLGVSNPSVTLMVRKMAELGLVDHQPYAPIRLTEEGRRLALAMVRRHRLIETWLVRDLGYSWDEVHDEAERLEHSVSELFVERLAEKLGHPEVDPHGDPIPAKDLSMRYPQTVLLCRAPEDAQVRLEQVDDSVPEALRLLAEQHLEIGAQLRVVSSNSGDVVLHLPEGSPVTMEHEVSHAVRVSIAA
ncbi:metal-dependent transcriptional regulator [Nesterenkonia massiliensis]|uniref:Manganese transport regulator n=1 Tax=Nesterenkonia massiliensis TaxID=1232429 RepID=A0ABT2HPF5_9MICC|nr:metal-dependent transcriptional regulator [Nesterenkonia massiliensis]MCT1606576.1 metal-dependent transcriptional regulator [Nesterenkonia massiliensis]